jgi:3'(2'), 5'-bisphosphate nucleotidase
MMKDLYKTAIKAAIEAGKEIMNIYDNENFQVELKNDDSPLTIADKKANEIINKFLLPTGIFIISEENRQLDFSERKNWDECWIVDPLDGTKEFIKKNGEFTVNIALVKSNIPVFGVIYVPARNEIYIGDVLANKSYKATLNGEEEFDWDSPNFNEIKPSKIQKKIRVVGSRSHMNKETLEFIEELKNKYKKEVEVVSKGSSLKFCLVAEGEADVYPRFAPTMEWDTAAGQAICNAVGLQVIDQDTSKGLIYNRENLLNNHFLISNFG